MAEKIKFSFLNKNKVKKQTNDLNNMTISEKEIVEGKVKFTRYNNLSKGMLVRMYNQIDWILNNCLLDEVSKKRLKLAKGAIQECAEDWSKNQSLIRLLYFKDKKSKDETNKQTNC